ncbi:MAG: hypothetical protein ABIY55_22355 [Kofleriaceae bacterium]
MSLVDCDPTPEDLEAERDAPRPGVWAGVTIADLRALTQDETDCLIRAELYFTRSVGTSWEREVRAAVGGEPRWMDFTDRQGRVTRTYRQRGGIDSDPLVRVLARRAWGDRDRQWFELRGVRKGDWLTYVPAARLGEFSDVARAWPSDRAVHAIASRDARPGELLQFVVFDAGGESLRVSDRLREPPVSENSAMDRHQRQRPR